MVKFICAILMPFGLPIFEDIRVYSRTLFELGWMDVWTDRWIDR